MRSGPLSGSQFRWYYAGQAVSLLGSAMTPVALAFAVLQVRNGQHLLGYILAAEIIPEVLLVLIGGGIADRYRRDVLIRLANLGASLSQAGVAVVVLSGLTPYWIFPMAVLNGGLAAFTSPAMRGIIPQVVAGQDIKRANSMLSTSRSVAKIAGSAVAWVLNAVQIGIWQVLGPIIALGTFGSAGWGLTQTVKAVGVLLASLALLRARPRRPVRDGLIFTTAAGLPMVGGDGGLRRGLGHLATARRAAGQAVAGVRLRRLRFPHRDSRRPDEVITTGGLAFIVIALLPLLSQPVRAMRPAGVPAIT